MYLEKYCFGIRTKKRTIGFTTTRGFCFILRSFTRYPKLFPSKARLFLSFLPPYQLTLSKIDSYLAHHPKKYYCSYLIFLLQDLCLALFTLLKGMTGGGGESSSGVYICLLSSATHSTRSACQVIRWPFTKQTTATKPETRLKRQCWKRND